jgi:hypothetical protein
MTNFHKDAAPADRHATPFQEFADLTARDNYAYQVSDIGKDVRVGTVAPYSFYKLTNNVGPVFIDLGAGGGGGGEANTASNVGGGAGVYKQKVGVNLELRSLVGTAPITVTQGTDTITTAISAATPSSSGSMSSTDKSKLDGVAAGATNTPLSNVAPEMADANNVTAGVATEASRRDHRHQVSTGVPVNIGTTNQEGANNDLARSDHVHAHGNQGGGALHADATGGASGFMPSSDKTKLDGFSAAGEYIRRDGTVPFTGSQSHGNNDITAIKTGTFNGEIDKGNVSGAVTVNWNDGAIQKLTLVGDATLTFTAPPGPTHVELLVIQDVNGGHAITWPGAVKWPKGNAPNLTVPGNSEDLVPFSYRNGFYYGGFLDDYAT